MEFLLPFFVTFFVTFLTVYAALSFVRYNLYLDVAKGWTELANKADLNAENLYDNSEDDETWEEHDLRVEFIRGWNRDSNIWHTKAKNSYNEVPKWYQKLYNKFHKENV